MKITELLKGIQSLDLTASNKEAVIDELVEKLNRANRLNSKTEFKAILKREAQSTTGIGKVLQYLMRRQKAVKQPSICLVEV